MTPTNKTIVHVRWADAHMSQSGWLEMDDYIDDGETIVDTVGFLIPIGEPGSKDKHVTVWQSLCRDEGIHAMHIPVAMVREMKVVNPEISLEMLCSPTPRDNVGSTNKEGTYEVQGKQADPR